MASMNGTRKITVHKSADGRKAVQKIQIIAETARKIVPAIEAAEAANLPLKETAAKKTAIALAKTRKNPVIPSRW